MSVSHQTSLVLLLTSKVGWLFFLFNLERLSVNSALFRENRGAFCLATTHKELPLPETGGVEREQRTQGRWVGPEEGRQGFSQRGAGDFTRTRSPVLPLAARPPALCCPSSLGCGAQATLPALSRRFGLPSPRPRSTALDSGERRLHAGPGAEPGQGARGEGRPAAARELREGRQEGALLGGAGALCRDKPTTTRGFEYARGSPGTDLLAAVILRPPICAGVCACSCAVAPSSKTWDS